jgi:hypothetical protein
MFNAAHRALQNPGIFTSEHYRQAAIAVVIGLAIRLIISIPVSRRVIVYCDWKLLGQSQG